MTRIKFNEIKAIFSQAGKSMRCSEAKSLLSQLGFDVRDGKRGGHKVFVHQGLSNFRSGSLNCDHGKNPEIKSPYIKKIIKIIDQYEAGLIELLVQE